MAEQPTETVTGSAELTPAEARAIALMRSLKAYEKIEIRRSDVEYTFVFSSTVKESFPL